MSFLSNSTKFRSMFDIMGCGPSSNRSPELDVYCKQITVMPLLNRRHSKSPKKTAKPVFIDRNYLSKSRDDELIATYRNSPEKSVKRIFLSQTQSAMICQFGEKRPCAPPVTPTPELLRKVEYVPSLQDIQAQRFLRGKLQDIEKSKKDLLAKRKELKAKKEAEMKKEEINKLRVFQRSQIYALNRVMTDLENQRFSMFQQQQLKNS